MIFARHLRIVGADNASALFRANFSSQTVALFSAANNAATSPMHTMGSRPDPGFVAGGGSELDTASEAPSLPNGAGAARTPESRGAKAGAGQAGLGRNPKGLPKTNVHRDKCTDCVGDTILRLLGE